MPQRVPVFLLCLLTVGASRAQTTQLTVRPPLVNVTVYLNGTALEHQAQVTLAAGLNRVVVSNLSPTLNEEKLEIRLGDEAELLSVESDQDPAAAGVTLNQTAADSLARTEGQVRAAEEEGSVRPDVDPALTSRLLFGTVNSLTEWYRPDGGLSADDLADALVATTFQGLRARPS